MSRLSVNFVKTYIRPRVMVSGLVAVALMLLISNFSNDQLTFQNKAIADNQHLVSLFVDGQRRSLTTDLNTVGDVLNKFSVKLNRGDVVEPAIDNAIDQPSFSINVYRAVPAVVVDDGKQTVVLTGHRAPRQIALDAGLQLYSEDEVSQGRVDDFSVTSGLGTRVNVIRAKPIQIILAGQIYNVRTQQTTARALFAEKGFKLEPKDASDVNFDSPLQKGQRIIINRFSQTIDSQIEPIHYTTEYEQDASQPLGFTAVKRVGNNGKKLVRYLTNIKNGITTDRNELDSRVLEQPVDEIVVRGTKKHVPQVLSFSDDNSARNYIFQQESGGRLDAINPFGCIGLGQSCRNTSESTPALAIVCPNWQSDLACQLSFWDNYATSRYGSWEGAYRFWASHNWW